MKLLGRAVHNGLSCSPTMLTLSGGFTMKPMNEVHSEQVRRRSDRSIDIEFYRRRVVTLRGELIARSLSATCHEVRLWAATTMWLARPGRRAILTMARGASGPPFQTASKPGHRV